MEKNKKILVTILTPIFNRKELIDRLYISLKNQTCYSFEWLIIDDGSTDNLESTVNNLIQNENNFNIRYFYKENGGKHTALNYGISKAEGKLLFIVDSDDFLTSKAIERILVWEKTISKNNDICGLGFCKGTDEEKMVGSSFTGDYLDATSLERDKFEIKGDKAEVFYTDILKNYPFPEFENEKFLTEAVVWDRIANDNYKIRWINEIIYICEYQSDGLSANWNQNLRNNPQGYTVFIKQKIHFNSLPNKDIYLLAKAYHDNLKLYSKRRTCELLEINWSIYFLYDFLFYLRKKISNFMIHIRILEIYYLRFVLKKYSFSFISQNCIGGLLYHDLNKRFDSPTINLYLNSSDFIKFVKKLDYYLALKLDFKENTDYPIGILDDIEIHFLHYKNKNEALKCWYERKKRIDKNKIIILMTDRDQFSDNEYVEFEKLHYKKILFTCNINLKNNNNVNYISKYKGASCLPNQFLNNKEYINLRTLRFFLNYKKEHFHD